jgi:hypothetical protein
MTASQRRLLLTACLACNREAWQPMCELCNDLEDAEERAEERRTDDDD